MDKLKCRQCKYEWYPRTPEEPIMCPKCKSRKWKSETKKEVKEIF